MSQDDEMNIDSPTTININCPPEQAGVVAAQYAGAQTPTYQGQKPNIMPAPAQPAKSVVEKLLPWLVVGALAFLIGKPYIWPEPDMGLDGGVVELIDENGNSLPVIPE